MKSFVSLEDHVPNKYGSAEQTSVIRLRIFGNEFKFVMGDRPLLFSIPARSCG